MEKIYRWIADFNSLGFLVVLIVIAVLYCLYNWYGIKHGKWFVTFPGKKENMDSKEWKLKFFGWQIGNSIKLNLNFFSFSVIIYSIICSVFATVIAQYKDLYNVIDPAEMIKFSEQQMDLSRTPPTLSVDPPPQLFYENFDFLICIDHTGSTSIEDKKSRTPEEEYYYKALTEIKLEIAKKMGIEPNGEVGIMKMIEGKKLNSLIVASMVQTLSKYKESNSQISIPYVDYKFKPSFIEEKLIKDCWYDLEKEEVEILNEQILDYVKTRRNEDEYTDFKRILKGIINSIKNNPKSDEDENKRKIAITIISDFVHDKEPISLEEIEPEIKHLSEINGITEVNLFKIPRFDAEDQRKSDELIQIFQKYFRHSPFSNERLLNIIHSYNSDYLANIESIISPTYSNTDSSKNLVMYYDDVVTSVQARIKLDSVFGKTPSDKELILKIKSNTPEKLQKIRIECSKLKASGELTTDTEEQEVHSLFAGISEKLEGFPADGYIQLTIRNLNKFDLPDLAIEVFPVGGKYKFLIPIEFKEKLPVDMAQGLHWVASLVRALFWIIMIGVGGWIGITIVKSRRRQRGNPALPLLEEGRDETRESETIQDSEITILESVPIIVSENKKEKVIKKTRRINPEGPVSQISGIGKSYRKILEKIGIKTVRDLAALDPNGDKAKRLKDEILKGKAKEDLDNWIAEARKAVEAAKSSV